MERKKRSKGSVWEFCYAKKKFGKFEEEMKASGQKWVTFCAHTHKHTHSAKLVVRIHDDSTTAVRCAVGVTEGFDVKVGLHQGSALSPCLFTMVMDRVTGVIRDEAPWTMILPMTL